MNWRFWQRETRSAEPYTDALVELLQRQASGADVEISADGTAVQTACRGLWARAFAIADVQPADGPASRALTADRLALMAEHLFDFGESLWLIEVQAGEIALRSAASYTIYSGNVYELELPEPNQIVTRFVSGEAVIHLRLSPGLRTPWAGRSPVAGQSGKSARLLAAVEQRLGQEAGGAIGHVLPAPVVDDTTAGLQADIKKMKGNTIMVPSMAGNWGADTTAAAPKADWRPSRIGADPPASLVQLRRDVCADVAAASGVDPVVLALGSDGTAKREGYRHFLHSTIVPIAALILPELRRKLDAPGLQLSFDRLFAGDLSGRARAFQSMVGGGMEVAKAAALAGLMESEA